VLAPSLSCCELFCQFAIARCSFYCLEGRVLLTLNRWEIAAA
jgi:hypothetical protein